MVIEQDGRSERSFDIYSLLLRQRIVFCAGEIEDNMANLIVSQLLHLAADAPEKEIYLYINSNGGSVSAGNTIISTMNFIKPDVSTILYGGTAASMGAMILSSGAKEKRFALPYSRVMCHAPSGNSGGKVGDMKVTYQEIEKIKDNLNQRLADNTGQPLEVIEKMMDGPDKWFSAEEAVEYGLIDAIMTKKD